MEEKNRFSKRLQRYAQVGVGGVKLMGGKLRGSDQETFAQALVDYLGSLKGPLVKAGQLLAMIPDLLPPAYAEKLMTLQSQAPAMGRLFVKRRLRGELGEQWQDHFASFEEEAMAAASLGQVHRASLKDGQSVAVKIQYPDMESVVHADLAQLTLVGKTYQLFNSAIDHRNILQEIETHLLQELDYLQEAANLQRFHEIFEAMPQIRVPKVFPALSTKRLLTMEFQEGKSFFAFCDGPQALRNILAQNLFQAWYYPLYRHGVLHADPHAGNYLGREDGTISLLDFGCVRQFPALFLEGILDLYHALLEGSDVKARQAYEKWGFQEITPELLEILNLWARYLYGPLLEDRVRLIDETLSSQQGRAVAKEVHRRLKAMGGIRPPAEFVFVDRAAVALGSMFMHLKAELNWHQLFESCIGV